MQIPDNISERMLGSFSVCEIICPQIKYSLLTTVYIEHQEE